MISLGGERGKFYRDNAEMHLPVYLSPELLDRLERLAERKGRDLSDVVSELLERDVALLEDML